MKKSDIYEIAIKILGLYVFTTSFGLLKEIFTLYSVSVMERNINENNIYNYSYLILSESVYFAIIILFALFLTFKTKTVVRYICKPEDFEKSAKLFTEKKTVYEIALVIMGLLLITWTLPGFAVKLKNYFQTTEINPYVKNKEIVALTTEGLKIFLGLIAFLGATSIARILSKEGLNEK